MTASSLPADLASGLRQRHIPGLDGIRALAVALVVLYHCGLPLPGGTGVLLFFVLSGFLITWLLLEESNATGTISLRNFYARRTLRILPPFYVYTACVLAVAWVRHHPMDRGQLVAALLYFNNYWQGIFGDPNTGLSHTWSLAVEEQFYILWPGIFLLLHAGLPRLARYLAYGVVTIWIYRLALIYVFHVNQGYIYEAFDTRADSLMTGCLLAVVLYKGLAARAFHSICDGRAKILITLSLLAISSALEMHYGVDYRDTIGFPVNSVLALVLIAQAVANPAGPLNWTPVRYLGRISYSMYLWQQLILEVSGKALTRRFPQVPLVVQIAVEFASVVAVASASWFFVEKPILRLKKRFAAPVPASRPLR